MASAVSSEYIGSRIKMVGYDHDPGGTSATLAGPDGGTTKRYVDMKEAYHMGCLVLPAIVGGNGITKVELVASAAATFSSVTVVKDTGSIQADALDDFVWLECNVEEVKQLGSTLRYVAARITQATGTDESKVIYVTCGRHFETTGMTTTTIA